MENMKDEDAKTCDAAPGRRSVDDELRLVEGIAKTMKAYRLDAVHVGDVKVARTQHEPLPGQRRPLAQAEQDEEDLMRSVG